MARSGRIWDWLAYFAIAVVLYGVLIAWAFHQAKTGGSAKLPLKWLGLAGLTGLVFGYTIKSFRPLWGRKFWLLLALFFAVHSFVWLLILVPLERAPLLILGLAAGPEQILLVRYLSQLLE
jgi:hypothetical protein